ncbi:MAG: hypothetical protein IPG71_03015 [bacterium]|nr:hypothetical protein [bacterium]
MTRRFLSVLAFLLCPVWALGMVEEIGSLRGFLLDACPDCSYDNWLSHVSERNVRLNYNDYGPPNLDPITNGFGGFRYIPEDAEGDATLANWRALFNFAIAHDWAGVDAALVANETPWRYELVHLDDAGAREYYIIRERLDSSFVDTNGDANPENDVVGGFRNGWGVFVFNPAPRHAGAVVEVPHPEDDYMAPPVATELFIRAEFELLLIAGAGREVMWDSTLSGEYVNDLSLSDPSRNGRHPFAVAHEAATDAWDTPPVSAFVAVQLHSYDHNEHGSLGDMQLSCFNDDTSPNPPIRDIGHHRDFVHALPRYPILGLDGDAGIVTGIDEYLTLWSNPAYSYFGADTVALRSIMDYLGAPDNQQGSYCHAEHDQRLHTENFVHVEMDEYPDALWMPTDFARWLPGDPPARLSNFRNVIDYYMPMIIAWDSALTWHEVPDITPPARTHISRIVPAIGLGVEITFDPPAFDQHFDTYEVYYDTVAITDDSPHYSRSSGELYVNLGNQSISVQRVYNLPPPLNRYRFAVRARDLAGNASLFSNEWGLVDSVIHDLTIQVNGSALELHWSAQYYDSLFEVHLYPPGANSYYIIGTTDTSFYSLNLPAQSGAHVLMVKRKL